MKNALQPIQEEAQAVTVLQQAKDMRIVTAADRTRAEDFIKAAKTLEDKIFEYLDPPRKKAYEDYQYHKKREDEALGPVQEARKIAKQKCILWDTYQEELRKEEECKAQEAINRALEDEKIRAAAEAEKAGEHKSGGNRRARRQ